LLNQFPFRASVSSVTLPGCSLNLFLQISSAFAALTCLGCLVIFVFANFDTFRFFGIRFSRYNAVRLSAYLPTDVLSVIRNRKLYLSSTLSV
jgi:hypothetical protein